MLLIYPIVKYWEIILVRGCENVESNLKQEWKATAGTNFTKPCTSIIFETSRATTKLRVAFSFCHVVSDPTLEVWRRRVGGAFVNFILLGEYYFIQYNVNLTKQTHTHHDALDARARISLFNPLAHSV